MVVVQSLEGEEENPVEQLLSTTPSPAEQVGPMVQWSIVMVIVIVIVIVKVKLTSIRLCRP